MDSSFDLVHCDREGYWTEKSDRFCFLCGKSNSVQFYLKNWIIAGLGTVKIGFKRCLDCGLVYQSPAVDPHKYDESYATGTIYCSCRSEPSSEKKYAIERQLNFIKDLVPDPGCALQIGCSDGYTISCFRELGWDCIGVDPCIATSKIAKERYGVDVEVAFFENWAIKDNSQYDLIIATHVIEHLMNPFDVLIPAVSKLKPGGYFLQEVPLFEKQDLWPPAYFSLGHVNYFSRAAMLRLLANVNLESVGDLVTVDTGLEYPYYTSLSRKTSDSTEAENYCKRQDEHWAKVDHKLRKELRGIDRVVVWGAGVHTTYLFAHTGIEDYANVDFLVDVDQSKQASGFGDYQVCSPEAIDFKDSTLAIVVSSYSAESEILETIWGKCGNAKVIGLYEQD